MSSSLDDLIEEYTHSAGLLSQMIEHGNQLMRQARSCGDYDRERALRVRQKDLYAQRAHVMNVLHHLKTYYLPCTIRIQ